MHKINKTAAAAADDDFYVGERASKRERERVRGWDMATCRSSGIELGLGLPRKCPEDFWAET